MSFNGFRVKFYENVSDFYKEMFKTLNNNALLNEMADLLLCDPIYQRLVIEYRDKIAIRFN